MNSPFHPQKLIPWLSACATIALVTGLCADEVSHPDFSPEQVQFFESKVRPILHENCFRCHGGTNTRGEITVRSGLQLISRKGLVLGGDHGPAIDVENPESSLLLEMTSYKDEHHEMPPTGKLEGDQLDTLRQWLKMGAPWSKDDINLLEELPEDEHDKITEVNEFTKSFWSHRPLVQPEVPNVADPEWQKHPIDAFVFSKLAETGLKPNGKATKAALARRAYYNLTGLPPKPEDVAAFVEDDSPDAWPKLIDRLLESPQYGEHWARHWLDIVRFAESNGFERDSTKEYIWRYRDYVIDAFNSDKPYSQFIMEQLAGDELENVTPDALIATGYHRLMQWDDEPADRLQHVYDVLDDNVRVTGEGFLGMTIGCARCHDHKGDPVSQEDYFSFMSFFKGVTQMDKRNVLQSLEIPAPAEVIEERRRKRDSEIAHLERQLGDAMQRARKAFISHDPSLKEQLKSQSSRVLIADSREKGQEWTFTTKKPADDWFEVGFRPPAAWKKGKGAIGTGVPNSRPRTKLPFKEIWMQKTFLLTEIPKSLELVIYHDEATEVYLNGQLIASFTGYLVDYKSVPLGPKALAVLQTGRNVVSVHCKSTGGGSYIDVGLREVDGDDNLLQLIKTQGAKVLPRKLAGRVKNMRDRLKQLRDQPLQEGITAMIVQERGANPGEMHVHIRGSAHAPGDKVEPAFPVILGGGQPVAIPKPKPDAKSSGRRKVLAQWIASPDNRRTSRVMANRIWQHHFGRGICPTPSDFGFLGEEPTHPELLDWLAVEFGKTWGIKDFHRLLMTSLTYQMASTGQDEALAQDPANQLFWRFPMRRLTAEEIRDTMIAVTGQLNPQVGGKSFYPVLDEEVLATSSTKAGKWGNSSEQDRNRRSVYIHIKRSLKPPELESFDFADTDAPCATRFVTTVPTQALAMLNGRFVNGQAALFAKRVREEVGDDDVGLQIKRALEVALSREATASEVERGLALIKTLQDDHQLSTEEAMNRFCLVALNLNEFIYLD